MVQEDIEELKRFGKGINGTRKQKQSIPQTSQGNSSQMHLKDMPSRLKLKILLYLKLCCNFIKKIRRRLFSKTRIELFKQRVFNGHYSKVHLRKPSPKYFTRLIETKKQIGDTTLIIRRRIHVKEPFKHDGNLYDSSVEPSMYYFHERVRNHRVIQKHQEYESLFDLPQDIQKQKKSFKDRIRLFFLRF